MLFTARPLFPQQVFTNQVFTNQCAACHGEDARGTAKGPGLAMNPRVAEQSAEQLRAYLEHGNPGAGMPSFAGLPREDLTTLAGYLRRINVETIVGPVAATESRKITWGAPQSGDWLTYNGNDSANRYSPLKQINTANVASLKLKWVFPISYFGLETTPLAADGVLYVTGPNQVFALDALTGGALWQYSRPASVGMLGDAKLGTNRGVAILRDLVFFVTDNAHLLALDRANGKLRWETPMAPDGHQPYGGTVAPLIVNDLVIAGVAGADHGIRGFVAAFKAETGALVWRHWTVPGRGEPGIETWQGKEPVGGGGSTWLTGSYDASSDTLYWPTGNPWPDSDDRDRPGDNLYTNCVLALNARTGDLKWHYQFTPHDVKDRDATEPNVLVDGAYKGRPAKLLLHADRNGFFYVLDRTTGEVLLAKPFLRRVDWAQEHRTRWPAGGKRSARLPERCGQLGLDRVLAGYAPLLFHGVGRVHRQAHRLPRPDRTAIPARGQHRDGGHRLGGSAAGTGARQDLVRSACHGRRPDLLRPAKRRLYGGGSADRQDAMAVPDQRSHEGFAHDLQLRRQPVRGGGRWPQYPLLRTMNAEHNPDCKSSKNKIQFHIPWS